MLRSVLHAKSGNIVDQQGIAHSVLSILRTSEDARTSTVFERLVYLPPEAAWALLRSSCADALPAYRCVELLEVKFWPNWRLERADRLRAQPDVYLRWSVGDPAAIVDMVVEAKLPGGQQNPKQWLDQLEAYRDNFSIRDDGEPAPLEDQADQVYYICVDGLGRRPSAEILERIPEDLPKPLPMVRFCGCSWDSIAHALDRLTTDRKLGSASMALVDDLRVTLEFCGHRVFHLPEEILALSLEARGNEIWQELETWALE